MIQKLIDKQFKTATKKRFNAWSEAIFDIVEDGYYNNILHNPRLVMYKLLGQTIGGMTIEKSNSEHIGAIIAIMKYQGRIPNYWTIDTTRSITRYSHFDSIQDGLDTLSDSFYIDVWKNQPTQFLLMCEASGYLGVIKNIADKFRIPYVPAKGDMSIQMKIDIANTITENTLILYFGDYDKAGLRIPKTIHEDMQLISGKEIRMQRMFVNEEDIETYNLEPDEKGQVQMEQFPEQIAIDETVKLIQYFMNTEQFEKDLAKQKTMREQISSFTIEN